MYNILSIFNRPDVAEAVLQTPLSFSLINKVLEPFPPNLQDIINH